MIDAVKGQSVVSRQVVLGQTYTRVKVLAYGGSVRGAGLWYCGQGE